MCTAHVLLLQQTGVFFMYIYGCGEVLMGKQNNHLK